MTSSGQEAEQSDPEPDEHGQRDSRSKPDIQEDGSCEERDSCKEDPDSGQEYRPALQAGRVGSPLTLESGLCRFASDWSGRCVVKVVDIDDLGTREVVTAPDRLTSAPALLGGCPNHR